VPSLAFLSALPALSSSAVAQTPDFYAVSKDDLGLYRIDGATLLPTKVGQVAGAPDPACGFRPAGLGTVALIDRPSDTLLVIDSCSASTEATTPLDHDVPNSPRGVDVHPDGNLYGVFAGLELRAIDIETGQTTLKSVISGTAFVEGIAFGPDSSCYAVGTEPAASSDSVYSLDIDTGTLTLIAQVPAFDLDALTFGHDGYLYSTFSTPSMESELYRIDPATGAFTNLGSIGLRQVSTLVAVHPQADCDGNGQQDECDVASGAGRDLNEDEELDACELLGTNYCVATVNSSGNAASMHAIGSTVILDNDVLLVGTDLPANQFGYFLMSAAQDFVPNFAGSQGNLCLGPPIARFNHPPAGKVLFSGDEGVMAFAPDLTNLPQGIVFHPGETWNFQVWFRDVVGSTFTSNTSDGLSVTWG